MSESAEPLIPKFDPGRPTKYRKEYDEEIIRFAREGCPETDTVTIEHFADHFDVVIQTLRNWVSEHPSFLAAFTRANEIAKRRMVDIASRNFIMTGDKRFTDKSYLTIMRNRFGYDDKSRVRICENSDQSKKTLTERTLNIIEKMLSGDLSLEDGRLALDAFKIAIEIENESKLRPLVEEYKAKMEHKK